MIEKQYKLIFQILKQLQSSCNLYFPIYVSNDTQIQEKDLLQIS